MGTERFRDKQIKIWTTEKEKQQLEKICGNLGMEQWAVI